ncbi:MAG: DUF4333 domain-containing protein [Actinomycetota bacterium]
MGYVRTGLAAAGVALAGCSFNVGGSDTLDSESVAEAVNEEFSGELQLGDLSTECDVPDDADDGDGFTCTSTSADGEIILWQGVATSQSEFDIETMNLLNVDAVEALEADIVASLVGEGVPVTEGAVDCGDTARVVDQSGSLVCAVTDPGGAIYNVTITIADLESGAFGFIVADEPGS